MSVLYDLASAVAALDGPLTLECFYCGSNVDLPAVYWHAMSVLLLHPGCAAKLGVHLLGDSREATLAADPGRHWRRRAIATVRQRLAAEEVAA